MLWHRGGGTQWGWLQSSDEWGGWALERMEHWAHIVYRHHAYHQAPDTTIHTSYLFGKSADDASHQGLVFTGGHISNVEGNINRGRRHRATLRGDQASQLISIAGVVEETMEETFLEDMSGIIAKGPVVWLNNAGRSGSLANQGTSTHTCLQTSRILSLFTLGYSWMLEAL